MHFERMFSVLYQDISFTHIFLFTQIYVLHNYVLSEFGMVTSASLTRSEYIYD